MLTISPTNYDFCNFSEKLGLVIKLWSHTDIPTICIREIIVFLEPEDAGLSLGQCAFTHD